MKQTALNHHLSLKKNQKYEFLEQMKQGVPWATLGELGAFISPYYRQGHTGKRRVLNKKNESNTMAGQAEKLKAGIQTRVEHPFRVIKRQFGFVGVHYRGLIKNGAQLFKLFTWSNLWTVRSKSMGATT